MAVNARILMGTVGLAASLALPGVAAGQYPNRPKPTHPGRVISQIINTYHYGQYPYGNYGYNRYGNQRVAIDRCARAIEARLNSNRGNWGYAGPHFNRYRNYGRVEGITRILHKNNGFRIWGVASSGWGGYQGYNRHNYGSYGYGAGADLRWDCRIDRHSRISDLDINRRPYNWRGY